MNNHLPGQRPRTPWAKIRWAPRLRPDLLRRLYETDAKGIHDADLCAEVGTYLFARCETFRLVHRGQVRCPSCGVVFEVMREETTNCPEESCGWSTNHDAYWKSIGNHYAWTGRAFAAYATYLDKYPAARSYREQIILIDQLIHSFHLDDTGSPVKSIASKLLEGNKKEVVRFLDQLSGIDSASKEQWRRTISKTIDARELGQQ